MTHDVDVTREGDWWLVRVADVGVTQARTLDQVEPMARDLVEAMTGRSPRSVEVDVRIDLGDLAPELVEVRQQRLDAEELTRKAAWRTRDVAHRLIEAGLSRRDAAHVLGVSRQRVAQYLDSRQSVREERSRSGR